MDNIKKYVIEFIEGKINPKIFIKKCEEDTAIFDWLQSIIPLDKKMEISNGCMENGIFVYKREKLPYDIKKVWGTLTLKAYGPLGIQLNVHSAISKIVMDAFPNEIINKNDSLNEKNKYLLEVIPSYICGGNAQELVEKIIDENLGASTQVIKDKIKKVFHIEGKKNPKWAQDNEWPFSKTGRPMKYLSQKNKDSETIELTFEDVDTGEKVIITDIY